MILFNSDYVEGAHPDVLRRLTDTNMEQTTGYGEDAYCAQAADLIRVLCQAPEAAVHFLMGGTQANLTVIGAALRPHQGVISADTGHIAVHETGAVEATGHKVLALPGQAGKIDAAQVDAYCKAHAADSSFEHMVQPGMVYISHPSEYGTVYTRQELIALREVCDAHGLLLFLDGARLAYGLACDKTELDLPDLARLCDVFYIGGTKAGALFGEAVVISNAALQKDFRYILKQRGGMLAKGRLLGLQFLALLEDGLYLRLGRHALEYADRLREAFAKKGVAFLVDSPTNQLFPILPDAVLEGWEGRFAWSEMERVDEHHRCVRFCTSWATRAEYVSALLSAIEGIAE